VAKHYGKAASMETLRHAAQVSKDGVSLLGIAEAAEKIGFNAKEVTFSYQEIIKAAKQRPYDAIKDWYNLFDASQNGLYGLVEKFKALHHTNGLDVNATIEKQISWSKGADIKGTPTFFVNGKKLPELFNWLELCRVLEYELKD
jgi:Peptidase C39 family/Thioredoxin